MINLWTAWTTLRFASGCPPCPQFRRRRVSGGVDDLFYVGGRFFVIKMVGFLMLKLIWTILKWSVFRC